MEALKELHQIETKSLQARHEIHEAMSIKKLLEDHEVEKITLENKIKSEYIFKIETLKDEIKRLK